MHFYMDNYILIDDDAHPGCWPTFGHMKSQTLFQEVLSVSSVNAARNKVHHNKMRVPQVTRQITKSIMFHSTVLFSNFVASITRFIQVRIYNICNNKFWVARSFSLSFVPHFPKLLLPDFYTTGTSTFEGKLGNRLVTTVSMCYLLARSWSGFVDFLRISR